MPELRKDPIVGRWVIISTDRAKRPTDFVRENMKIKGGFCPFCYGNEGKTPPEIQAYRPNPNGGPAPQRDTPGWTVRVVPNKFPALGIEGNLNRQAEGMFDRMNGIGAHEVIIETPDHTASMATLPPKRIEDVLWTFRDRILDLKKDEGKAILRQLVEYPLGPRLATALEVPENTAKTRLFRAREVATRRALGVARGFAPPPIAGRRHDQSSALATHRAAHSSDQRDAGTGRRQAIFPL